jgi:hypothetical protein
MLVDVYQFYDTSDLWGIDQRYAISAWAKTAKIVINDAIAMQISMQKHFKSI